MAGDVKFMVWRGLDELRVEAVSVEHGPDGHLATGTQIGSEPLAYRLDYRLEASRDFITTALEVSAVGHGWRRELDLRHDAHGAWTSDARARGDLDRPAPGGDASILEGALDCDIGRSPFTNMLPIRRSGLQHRQGAEDYLMAWVSVPDLSVVASPQRYEHVSRHEDGSSVVRYVDRGLLEGFTAHLELDGDGFVVLYPGLAERIGDRPRR